MTATGRTLAVRSSRMVMGDTDAAGLLYFAAPYPWLEQLFTGWLHEIGHPLSELLAEGTAVPCVSSEASYHAPLRLDMSLELQLRADRVGRTSFGFVLDVRRPGEVTPAVSVRSRHVFARRSGQSGDALASEPLPEWLREALT